MRKRWKWPLVYLVLLALAPLAVALRNWMMRGMFVLIVPRTFSETFSGLTWDGVRSIMILLNASYLAKPDFIALVLWPGTILAVVALVWRHGPMAYYPMGLAWTVVGLVVPYFFLFTDNAAPRFSIHLIPIATLSLVVVMNHSWIAFFGKESAG